MEENTLDFEEKFLLLLYFSEDNKTLITRAMKLMFMFEEIFEIRGKSDLEFIPYNLGPFANDFQINITPLITEELVGYREYCDTTLNYISESYYKEYFLEESRKKEIERIIENEYLPNKSYSNLIRIIEFITKYYSNFHLWDLIQICYFLKPEFTQKSIIDKEVKSINRVYNQTFIQNAVNFMNDGYILKLFRNIEGILRIYGIDKTNIEKENFSFIIEEHLNAFKEEAPLINLYEIIEAIDNISIKDSRKTFKFLKFKLLEIYSLINEDNITKRNIRTLLLYFLKNLALNWPLNRNEMRIFRKNIKDLKNTINIDSIKDDQPPIDINYALLKRELENEIQLNALRQTSDNKIIRIKKGKTDKSKTFLIDKINLSNLYEEFSDIEVEELEKHFPSEDNEATITNPSEF